MDQKDLMRATRRISDAQLSRLFKEDKLQALTRALSPDHLGRMLAIALPFIEEDVQNSTATNVVARAPASTLLGMVLPGVEKRSFVALNRLMRVRAYPADFPFRVSLASSLLDHSDEAVRTMARNQLKKDTGSSNAWLFDSINDDSDLSLQDLKAGLLRYGLNLEGRLDAKQREDARMILIELGAGW
jgi:hypothetical protein